MSLLLVTAISMGISLVMDDLYILLIYKTIADLGYKPAPGEINNLPGQIYNPSTIFTIIPIINVLIRILFYKRLDNILTNAFDFLREHEIIVEMPTEELKEYEKRKNGMHAYRTFKKIQAKEDSIQTLYMVINGEENEIYYRMENNKLVILKVEGPLSELNLTQKELESRIEEAWDKLFKSKIKLYGSKFFKEIRFNIYCETNDTVDENLTDYEEIEAKYDYDELKKLFQYFGKEEKLKVKTLGSIKKQ